MARQPCVCILASGRHGTIYIGVTSDLTARLHQHRSGSIRGFTARYDVKRLVHFERFDGMESAIAREKRLRAWRRDWKIALIEQDNPFWEDRAIALGFPPPRVMLTKVRIHSYYVKQMPPRQWMLNRVQHDGQGSARQTVTPSSG